MEEENDERVEECCICQCSLAGGADGDNVDSDTRIGVYNPCGHVLHAACAERWQASCSQRRTGALKCPMCNQHTNGFQRIFLDLSKLRQLNENGNDSDDSVSSMEDYCDEDEDEDDAPTVDVAGEDSGKPLAAQSTATSVHNGNAAIEGNRAGTNTIGQKETSSNEPNHLQQVIDLLSDDEGVDTSGSNTAGFIETLTLHEHESREPREHSPTSDDEGEAETYRLKAAKYRRKLKLAKARSKKLNSNYKEVTTSYKEVMKKIQQHKENEELQSNHLELEKQRNSHLRLEMREIHLELTTAKTQNRILEQTLQRQEKEVRDVRRTLSEYTVDREKIHAESRQKLDKSLKTQRALQVEKDDLRKQLDQANKLLNSNRSVSQSSSQSQRPKEKRLSQKRALRELASAEDQHLQQQYQCQQRRLGGQSENSKLSKGSAHAKRMIKRASSQHGHPSSANALDLLDRVDRKPPSSTTADNQQRKLQSNLQLSKKRKDQGRVSIKPLLSNRTDEKRIRQERTMQHFDVKF